MHQQTCIHFTDTIHIWRVHAHIPGVMALVCVSGTSIVFDMSLTYILVALMAVILNNVLVERLSMHTRITVGKAEEHTHKQISNRKKNFTIETLLLSSTRVLLLIY